MISKTCLLRIYEDFLLLRRTADEDTDSAPLAKEVIDFFSSGREFDFSTYQKITSQNGEIGQAITSLMIQSQSLPGIIPRTAMECLSVELIEDRILALCEETEIASSYHCCGDKYGEIITSDN